MGRGHGRAVLVGVAQGQVFQAGAANHRAVDPGARGRYAETRGVATARRERADQVRVGAAGVGVLLQRRHGHPVGSYFRDEKAQPGNRIGVVQVVVVAGGEDGQDSATGRSDGAVIGATGQGAQQRLDLRELRPGVVHGEVREIRIAPALGKTIGDADAPTVVDDPRTAGHQAVPAGLVHRAIVAQDDAILGAGVAVVGADDLRIEGHAVHRHTVAVAGGDAADVGAVGTELAVRAHRRAAVIAEGIAGLHRNIGVGVLADPAGDKGHDLVLAGELRVLGIHRLVEDPQLDVLAAVAGGIGAVGVDRPQPPVGLEFAAAPAAGITQAPSLHVGRGLGRAHQRCPAHQHPPQWGQGPALPERAVILSDLLHYDLP